MYDPRLDKLADVLVGHSMQVEPGESVLVEAFDVPEAVVIALIRAVREAGGVPLVSLKNNRIQRELIRTGDERGLDQAGEYEAYRMERVQAYVGVRGSLNIAEMSDVPSDAMQAYEERWLKPVHFDIRVPRTKWVVLRWPSPSMAQQARASTEAFEDFYFDVCTLDYGKMGDAIVPLSRLMEETDEVHISGPGTDLRFSIRDIPVVPCSGRRNIPDGECFTAPVRDSVSGRIAFNTPTLYRGKTFSNIHLSFTDGRIVEASADDTEGLAEILDADEGARYIGEFALGFNPYITSPMLDILFDEKIAGSLHLTPGKAYEEADNGNQSSIHWDMVMIQTPEYGGGEMSFDGTLVRKDGRFVLSELEALNPENLK
jgi:aminopeptidase